jgi:ankyrin repeat protein
VDVRAGLDQQRRHPAAPGGGAQERRAAGQVLQVDLLLDRGARFDVVDNSDKTAIVYAAAKGFTGIVARLLDAGIDVNRPYGNHLTVLMWAAGHGNEVPPREGAEMVSLLLERGAETDLADNRGRTALMIAAELGHDQAVGALLEAGARIDLQDKDGKTARDLAEAAGWAEVASLLDTASPTKP